MANASLFTSIESGLYPAADTENHSGAPAYRMTPKHQLAQYAATGCLHDTYYANATTQLETVLALCEGIDNRFIAQTAIYCRERGYMKDMPALLTAVLAARAAPELTPVFNRVIDNGKLLRNFVQILRSGAVGRKSLGTRPKKLVQNWLNAASEKALLAASVGQSPSLADVVKMVHPKPVDTWRDAFFAWLIGRPYSVESLPSAVKAFEAYKRDRTLELPDVPFQMLTALNLTAETWGRLALRGGWHMIRMNLNTFARHGVFESERMTQAIAARLRARDAIAKARVFPYQLMAAYCSTTEDVPRAIREALQDAMEIALANVPQIKGKVVVCPDVSGSMSSPVTGMRGSSTTAVRCIDVAALIAAAILRKNSGASVLPFENRVVQMDLNPRDTVMTNAQKLASIGGGGTNCSAPLALLNLNAARADIVIFVSDNESWMDANRHGATQTIREWEVFRQRNPRAKLVCIDIAPYGTTQAMERDDILNVGGFSDDVFSIVAAFASGQMSAAHWLGEICSIGLEEPKAA